MMKKAIQRPERGVATRHAPVAETGLVSKAQAELDAAALLGDLHTLVRSARQRIAAAAYSTQTLLCWHVGRRLDNEHLQRGRAAYGKQILVTLSQQLSWSHFHALLPMKDALVRDFYAEMCRLERWDVSTLRQKISGMLFQRTALSKRPQAMEHAREQAARRLPDPGGQE
jgi:hypothetical protein